MDSVQRFYGKWSLAYDVFTDRILGLRGARKQLAESLEPGLGDGKNRRIIEMGCGTGVNFRYVVRELSKTEVGYSESESRDSSRVELVGLDITRGMLSRARKRAVRLEDPNIVNIELLHADARSPPLGQDFDAVYASFVLGMFSNPEEVVETWIDDLNPKKVVLLDAQRTEKWYGPALNQLFKGFVFASTPNRTNWPGELTRELEERNRKAREVLEKRARSVDHHELGAGLLKLTEAGF